MDNNDRGYSQSLDNQLAKTPPPQARCLNRPNHVVGHDEVHCLYLYRY